MHYDDRITVIFCDHSYIDVESLYNLLSCAHNTCHTAGQCRLLLLCSHSLNVLDINFIQEEYTDKGRSIGIGHLRVICALDIVY